ncbi:MAG: dihydrolipoyl dehydrogenase, partial [Elusimicrobia bacterium]|nr:dihydrolipoyl dehydrogenase [Elusimicrobiota bacterium]
ALLHAARLVNEARAAAAIGIRFGEPEVDLDRLRSWKEGVVRKMTGGLGQLAKQRKLRIVRGRGVLEDPHTLRVEGMSGGSERLAFQHAILATGSRPATLPFLPGGPRVWDLTAALRLQEVPKRLLVIGGGYIGLEMATVYASLGAEVSVVEMLPGILMGCDRDLALVLGRRLGKLCKEVLLETSIVSAEPAADGVRVRLQGQGLVDPERVYDAVLVSVGRKPNSAGLGLENTRVELDPRGFVKTDDHGRTAEPSIFAIGDVAGEPMLAHKASHEGRVAAEVIAGKNVVFEPRAIPAVVFTDPEIAWCGLTETQAAAENREVKVCRFPWGASGRALTLNRADGVTKVLCDPENGRVLGVAIAGPGAGELISEAVLAVEMGATAEDLALSIHPHPTLGETIMESAEAFEGTSTHIFRPKRPVTAP